MGASPHERFIIGQGESGRQYVIHTHTPRFIAELYVDDESTPLTQLALVLPESGEVLANFAWIDDPAGCDVVALRADIEEFLAEADFRGECEIEADRRREELEE